MAAGFGSESGRSLVEMLGTLAIMGILTIGGIAGFNYAMNKQRANATVNYVNQLAVLGTGQMLAGGTPKLLDYPNHTPSGYPADITTEDGKDNLFYIEIDEVPTAVCEELFSRQSGWKMVNDIGFISVGEENIGACSDKEKVGMWFEIKATADKDPEPPFHCTTDQDCYNEKGANYVCKLPRGVCELSCPAGQIFTGGSCQQMECKKAVDDWYSCYLNGKRCAFCKSPTPTSESQCRGFCKPQYCSGRGTWRQVTMNWSGFGCETNDGLYCAYNNYDRWQCAAASAPTRPCCDSSSFGTCERGFCDADVCSGLGNYMVFERFGGCKITKNNKTAYCTRTASDTWVCNYEKDAFTIVSTRVGYCGTCTEVQLRNGECGTCFTETRACKWGEYDADSITCVGELNGHKFSCDFSGRCYYGEKKDNYRCGYSCNGDPTKCTSGICNTDRCPEGSTWTEDRSRFIFGCQMRKNGYTMMSFYDGIRYGCTVYEGGKYNSCGQRCDSNCDNCKVVRHEACAAPGKCVKDGSSVDYDGDGVADCECDGQLSNGHCCEVGHTYINGACNLYSCGANQCVSASGICQNLGSQWIRDENGNCKAK